MIEVRRTARPAVVQETPPVAPASARKADTFIRVSGDARSGEAAITEVARLPYLRLGDVLLVTIDGHLPMARSAAGRLELSLAALQQILARQPDAATNPNLQLSLTVPPDQLSIAAEVGIERTHLGRALARLGFGRQQLLAQPVLDLFGRPAQAMIAARGPVARSEQPRGTDATGVYRRVVDYLQTRGFKYYPLQARLIQALPARLREVVPEVHRLTNTPEFVARFEERITNDAIALMKASPAAEHRKLANDGRVLRSARLKALARFLRAHGVEIVRLPSKVVTNEEWLALFSARPGTFVDTAFASVPHRADTHVSLVALEVAALHEYRKTHANAPAAKDFLRDIQTTRALPRSFLPPTAVTYERFVWDLLQDDIRGDEAQTLADYDGGLTLNVPVHFYGAKILGSF